MRKRYMVVSIVFLLVISSIGPSSFGEDSSTTEKNKLLEDLKFYCTTPNGFNEVKFDYYKEQLLKQDVDKNIKEYKVSDSEKLITIQNTQLIIASFNGPMNSSWPMYCHDTRHTGRSPYNTTDNYGVEQWKFWTNYGIESSPAIDNDGIIYFGSLDGYLYALYPNGTEKWRFDCNDWVSSSPAIAEDGTIYIGSWDDHLYAVNPDGTEKWKFYTYDTVRSSPAIAEDGTIYFGVLGPGNNIGRLYALYSNGTEKWHFDTGFWIYKSPAIGDDGTVYITSEDNHMYALYQNNGTLKWSFSFGDWPGSPSIGDDGSIYVGSWDDYLYAFYPNGTMKWKHGIGWGTGNTPSIGLDGTIYVGGESLYAVNSNGTRKWTFSCGNMEVTTSVAISNEGTIYFGATEGTNRGDIIAVYQNGIEKWRRTIADEWVHSSPAIDNDGTIYIGSSSANQGWPYGYLYAFHIGELDVDANGPYYGLVNQPVHFVGSATGGSRPYIWFWDFGDTQTSDEQNPTHIYTNPGNFTVTLTATDNTSNTTSDTTFAWIQETNTPPDKPTIEGTIKGNIETSYSYNVSASDSDENIIWYYIDWGDNSNTGWIGPFDSSTEITQSHSWSEKGTYIIKVKAKDPYNAESSETTLEVTMPKTRVSYNSLLLRFLEQFPDAFPILKYVIVWR